MAVPERNAPLTDEQALDIGMTHLRNQAEAGYPWAIAVVAEVERLREDNERLHGICGRAVDALRYEANPVCDEWDDYLDA